jgi:hypothetical protein
MAIADLKIDNATTHHDTGSGITYITYRGVLDSEVTVQVYDWLNTLYEAVGIDSIYGQVFDFRAVKQFAESNLTTARRTSNRMNMVNDTSKFPVALLVENHLQEETLRGPMRIPEQHARKRIVWSEDEAHQFLQEWNKSKDRA